MNRRTSTPRSRWLVALAIATLMGVGVGAPAMSLREWRTLNATEPTGQDHASYYLVGVLEGVLEAEAQAVRQGAKPRLCLQGRHPEPASARVLFTAELLRQPGLYEADMPTQLVMAHALAIAFACP